MLRYRVEQTDDGLAGEEGTFTICSFWLVSALCEIGEVERARELCEKLLAYASELGLYAEEIDPRTGRHLGNFPQAFTHLALINAVMHVIQAEATLEAEFTDFSHGQAPAATAAPAKPAAAKPREAEPRRLGLALGLGPLGRGPEALGLVVRVERLLALVERLGLLIELREPLALGARLGRLGACSRLVPRLAALRAFAVSAAAARACSRACSARSLLAFARPAACSRRRAAACSRSTAAARRSVARSRSSAALRRSLASRRSSSSPSAAPATSRAAASARSTACSAPLPRPASFSAASSGMRTTFK